MIITDKASAIHKVSPSNKVPKQLYIYIKQGMTHDFTS